MKKRNPAFAWYKCIIEMKNPKVSAIIPVYNGEKFIVEAIKSVLSQTYENIEIIVVNDGSTDKSEEKILDYAKHIKYIFQENKGIAEAYNAGIEQSTGDYISFLEQDDVWLPEKTEIQVKSFDENAGAGLVFSLIDFKKENISDKDYNVFSSQILKRGSNLEGDAFKDMFLRDNFIGTFSCVMVKISVMKEIGSMNDRFKICVDYDLFLRIAYKYDLFCVNKPLAIYRIHGSNTSKNSLIAMVETKDIIESWYRNNDAMQRVGGASSNRLLEIYGYFAWMYNKDITRKRAYLWKMIKIKPFKMSSWANYALNRLGPSQRSWILWKKEQWSRRVNRGQ